MKKIQAFLFALVFFSGGMGVNAEEKHLAYVEIYQYQPYNPENGPMHHTDPWGPTGGVNQELRSRERYRREENRQRDYNRDYMLRGNPRYDLYLGDPQGYGKMRK